MKRRKSRAQAMVEFAIVAPLLFTLLFGLIEAGRLLFVYGTTVTAARQAVRYGSTTGESASNIPYYADCDGIRQAVKNLNYAANYTDADIKITYDRGVDSAGDSIPVPGIDNSVGADECDALGPTALSTLLQTGDRIIVRVSTNWVPLVQGLVNLPPLTLISQSARTILLNVDIQVTAPPGQFIGSGNAATRTAAALTAAYIASVSPPTITNTPPNTSTPSSATAAFTPTKTVSPTTTKTVTGTPPTLTPSSTPTCFVGTSTTLTLSGNTLSYTVTNNNSLDTITINDIIVLFDNTTPVGQSIIRVSVNGLNVWAGNNSNSPSTFSNFQDSTTIDPGGSATVSVLFSDPYNTSSTLNEQVVTGFIEEGCSAVLVSESGPTATATSTFTLTPSRTPTGITPSVTPTGPTPTFTRTLTPTLTPSRTPTPCTLSGTTTITSLTRTGGNVDMSWSTTVTGYTTFEIWKSTDGGLTYNLLTTDTASPANNFDTINNGQTLWYKIRPINSCVNGAFSAPASISR